MPLSCPSCNTAFNVSALPANRRATCPRCGDVFPVRGEVAGDAGAEPVAVPQLAPSPVSREAQAKRSVVRTVLIAAAMGLVGLAAGLAVYFTRERPKPADAPSPPAIVSSATPAAELQGLRYLPADTNVAFALQPGPFLDFAGRTNQDPGELLTRAGLPSKLLGAVGQLGLSLPQIDHLAGGTSLGNGALDPRLTLVLVLRSAPADEDEFLRRLKAKKHAGAKVRYDAELAGLPLTLARASATVWVFGFDAKKDLAAVDKEGFATGAKHFPAALAETIATRVPPDAAAWLATNAERWADKPGVQFVVGELMKKKDWLPVLAQGRAALAALSFGEEPRVRLFVQAADDATGERARAYFKSKAGDKAQHGGAGEYALLDMPIDPATAYATLQQFLGDSAKK